MTVLTDRVRRLYRRIVPLPMRHRLRVAAREAPMRVRDLPADLRERWRGSVMPLPPASLRGAVGIDSSRAHFDAIGRRVSSDVLSVFDTLGLNVADYPRWLDFGCGAGRAARHIAARPDIKRLTGVDVDTKAIRWAARRLRDEYVVIAPKPPTKFADASFDVAYAISVFTHFDEEAQFTWLAELHRLIRPGGLFIVTTHGAHLTVNRPDMTQAQLDELSARGFAFQRGFGAFNDDS
ncbi:MAG TPA: class I SAM-dependent methyltransferase, partial [Thermoanaerobaculia bacterium]|nr:class I SAM-dependent methyltransferase [Thermoanaerobaculia bacterium]